MLIEVKDLQIGDEIIISSNSNLKYLKILKLPKLNKNLDWRGNEYYGTARCSIGGTEQTYQLKRYGGQMVNFRATKYEFETDCSKHTLKRNFNLNHRHIYLVKRENNLVETKPNGIFA